MNIPTQDHRNVVAGVVSAFEWLTNAWRARPGEQDPVPATLAGGINTTIPLHDKAPCDAPGMFLRMRGASGQDPAHREQSGARAHRRSKAARVDRMGRLTAALAGYVPWSGRHPEDEPRHSLAEGLQPLLDMVPGAVIAVDDAHRVVLVNEPAATLFGYTAEELGGMSFVQLFPRMADDDAKAGSGPSSPGAPGDGLAGADELRTAIARCKDGCERTVSVKCTQYGAAGAAPWIVLIVDPCGQEEARRDEQQRAHLARASELGEMAAALAHEINQPLTAILSNAQAAQRFLELTPSDISDLREALADIVADSFRATEIVRKLRQFVRRVPPDTLPLDMGNLAREVMHLMRRDAVSRGVRMTLDSAAQVPLVRCDKIQLQQVMINLLLNAFDAVEGCCAEDRVVSVTVSTAPQGEGVRIAVSDRGLGLNADQVGEVFKPFSSSKPHGLGLGLSISCSIVSMHGGRLWAENNGDRGATFHILLPSASGAEGCDPRQSS
ncbi:Adaptive-response sensory-kinase SasA [Paraburkholderia ultramafica]|uniref:histidine kinase n=1 Tax=Paraburkholderia ultramafica TaxID=1544867 RepID=A0A6S7CYE8_9BURK|nr:ATP-binding protein [Paraburkholderia ultramafica]CAB3801086.1 Adaptive-response sensory-kinase SasA [Paraburkholderia ultramafica]